MTCAHSNVVLYIEDSPVNARLMERIFTRHLPEMELRVAEDGVSGLKMLREQDPDLLLLDCHLPGMSGLEVLRSLRAAENDIPVVVVTADAQGDLNAVMLATGANALVTKPFDFDVLCDHVHRFVAERSDASELSDASSSRGDL